MPKYNASLTKWRQKSKRSVGVRKRLGDEKEKSEDKIWKDALWQELHTAGEEETLLAIEKGHVIENVPWITVHLDGGWSKRSYGHSNNAASGVVTPAEIEQISATTIGQFNNQRYMSERSFRVTASNFGSVVKRRLNTACYNLVKKVLHGDIVQSEAVTYGKIKESVAINRFEKELGKNVQPAGLYTLYIYFRDY
ncbi:restriction endonuclease [Holotrichia oblita]|uniref:Restriction endonuclease n=1 Tax=Holotrichia oblita TaxID=644536 RepID=A0ACB9SLS2_HOLOL|nr:restriction endonuclease [Holotrichia oblita]